MLCMIGTEFDREWVSKLGMSRYSNTGRAWHRNNLHPLNGALNYISPIRLNPSHISAAVAELAGYLAITKHDWWELKSFCEVF